MGQGLTPGVQDGENADLGAEASWIGGERRKRARGRAHQQSINLGLVLEGDLGGLWRQGEDHMEIGNGQDFALAGGEPPWHLGQCRLRQEL